MLKLYDMIYDDPKFREYIGNISSLKMKSRPTYPIEIRKYWIITTSQD